MFTIVNIEINTRDIRKLKMHMETLNIFAGPYHAVHPLDALHPFEELYCN